MQAKCRRMTEADTLAPPPHKKAPPVLAGLFSVLVDAADVTYSSRLSDVMN